MAPVESAHSMRFVEQKLASQEHDLDIQNNESAVNIRLPDKHQRRSIADTDTVILPSNTSTRFGGDSRNASQRSPSFSGAGKLSSETIVPPTILAEKVLPVLDPILRPACSQLPVILQPRHSGDLPIGPGTDIQPAPILDVNSSRPALDTVILKNSAVDIITDSLPKASSAVQLPDQQLPATKITTGVAPARGDQVVITFHHDQSLESAAEASRPTTSPELEKVACVNRDGKDRAQSPSSNESARSSVATNAPAETSPTPFPAPIRFALRSTGDHDNVAIEQGGSPIVMSSETFLKSEARQTTSKATPLNLFERISASFYRNYAPRAEPALVMPSGPTEQEKDSYLSTNRLPLYAAGTFSFLSLAAGMWLFTVSSSYFAWFGVLCGALQLYMGISYYVGLVGKDFDIAEHRKILAEHPIDTDSCPTVDIYLPVCKEPIEILENTWKYVSQIDYPKNKLKVYVLDDGDLDSVRDLAARFNYEYIVRGDRPRLKKAGNLRWAFTRTTGDFFNIYDADFCPRPDVLRELIPRLLADPEIALVQTPQFFRIVSEQTWVEQGAGAIQELFYRVIQVNRDRWGASICVGSNALYRRAALEEVGGTAEIGFSEDVHTGFGCVDRGWKVKYIPLCLACGICPDSPRAFFSQQMRWCMGSTTLLSNPHFWKSRLTPMQKLCYLCGFLYYSAMALSIFVNPLPGILMVWLRPDFFKYFNLAFAIPSLLYTIFCFRLWAKASYGLNVQYIQVIQSYAYLTAIKDRIFGRALQWAPTGDTKAHKNNKYRNMRILAWTWLITWEGALISGMVFQIIRGMAWYNCVPLLALDLFNLFLAHKFLLCRG